MNNYDLSLRQIETFLVASEFQSITQASRELFMNQAAVSRHISHMEERIGVKLFMRTNRGVELTPGGEQLYEELRPVYDRLVSILNEAADEVAGNGDLIRVGVLASAEVEESATIAIRELKENHPGARFVMRSYDYRNLIEALMGDLVDLIFTYSISFDHLRGTTIANVAHWPTLVSVSKKSEAASHVQIPSALLANMPLYLTSTSNPGAAEDRAVSICRMLGFEPKDIIYVSSYLSFELAIRSGRGFGISGSAIKKKFGREIKTWEVGRPDVEQYVIAVYKNSSPMSDMFAGQFAV